MEYLLMIYDFKDLSLERKNENKVNLANLA